MSNITCRRCGAEREPAPTHRVPFAAPAKERVLAGICGECWKQWEENEIKVINENRLSFLDREHRLFLERACMDYLFAEKQAER